MICMKRPVPGREWGVFSVGRKDVTAKNSKNSRSRRKFVADEIKEHFRAPKDIF